MASIICIGVDFGDFLDGVVARYWVDDKKAKAALEASKEKDKKKRADSPAANSDDDSFGTFEIMYTSSFFLSFGVRV